MVQFMDTLAETVTNYRPQLLTAGAKEMFLEGILGLANSIHNERIEQVNIKKARPVITQERTQKLNTVWGIMETIDKAAQYIFTDNPAKLKMYSLPRPPAKGSSDSGEDDSNPGREDTGSENNVE